MGSSSEFETDSRDQHLRSKIREARLVDNARIGATALSLLMAITILGMSGDTLRTYDNTKIAPDVEVFPSLWPTEFNIRPTVALVAGSAIVMVTNVVSLCFGKVASVSFTAYKSPPSNIFFYEFLQLTTLMMDSSEATPSTPP